MRATHRADPGNSRGDRAEGSGGRTAYPWPVTDRAGLLRRGGSAASVASSQFALAGSNYVLLAIAARHLDPAGFAVLTSYYLLINTVGRGLFAAVELETTRSVAHARATGVDDVAVRQAAVRQTGLLLVAVAALLVLASPLTVPLFDRAGLDRRRARPARAGRRRDGRVLPAARPARREPPLRAVRRHVLGRGRRRGRRRAGPGADRGLLDDRVGRGARALPAGGRDRSSPARPPGGWSPRPRSRRQAGTPRPCAR